MAVRSGVFNPKFPFFIFFCLEKLGLSSWFIDVEARQKYHVLIPLQSSFLSQVPYQHILKEGE